MARARDGTAHPKNKLRAERFSTWSLICEEALDTEHHADWCDDIVAELARRGLPNETSPCFLVWRLRCSIRRGSLGNRMAMQEFAVNTVQSGEEEGALLSKINRK